MRISIAIFVVLACVLPICLAQDRTGTVKVEPTTQSEDPVPAADPAFSAGMEMLVKKVFVDKPTNRVAIYRAAADCLEKSGLADAPDVRIAEQTLRLAYVHRKNGGIAMGAGVVTGLARKYLAIRPGAFVEAAGPFLHSSDKERRDLANAALDSCGIFDVEVADDETHSFAEMDHFIHDLTPQQRNSLSPDFVRNAFVRDPKLAWLAFFDLDKKPAATEILPMPAVLRRGQKIQGRVEYVNYITWAMTQIRPEMGPKRVDEPLAVVLLRELSESPSRCDRLFVLGVMDQIEFDRVQHPPLMDLDILEELEADADPLVKAVAKQVRMIEDERGKEKRANK